MVFDVIHSHNMISVFWNLFKNHKAGAVYNTGGNRHSNFSMLEAIQLCEELTNQKMTWTYSEQNRKGDHLWWTSVTQKFASNYPDCNYKYNLREIFSKLRDRCETDLSFEME